MSAPLRHKEWLAFDGSTPKMVLEIPIFDNGPFGEGLDYREMERVALEVATVREELYRETLLQIHACPNKSTYGLDSSMDRMRGQADSMRAMASHFRFLGEQKNQLEREANANLAAHDHPITTADADTK